MRKLSVRPRRFNVRPVFQTLEPRRLLSALYPGQQFPAQLSTHTGGDVALADLTGDGVPDLVAAMHWGVHGTISVSAGNGDGTFQPQVETTAGISGPLTMVIGDFTGDGLADVAVAGPSASAAVRIVPGTGAGLGPAQPTTLPTGNATRKLIAADLTGNGLLDLVSANSGSGNVSVLLQTAPGTFASAVNYATASQPYSVAAGDFNGDGLRDLVVANSGANSVSYLRNLGGGTFDAPVHFTVASQPRSIVVGDFNGDGKLDVAAGSFNSSNVSVLLGNGAGSFGGVQNFNTQASIRNLIAVDLDADGKLDLLAAANSERIAVLRGAGDGTFLPVQRYLAMPDTGAIAAADINADGILDAVVVSPSSRFATAMLGKGDGSFLAASFQASGPSPTSLAIGDVNGDGKPDIAIANETASAFALLFNDGQGAFPTSAGITTSGSPVGIVLGDLNNDGRLDVVIAAGGTSRRIAVRLANTSGGFNANTPYIPNGTPGGAAVGDFNNDGFLDIVSVNRSNNATGQPNWGAAMLINNGAGAFLTITEIDVPVGSNNVVAADFNNDGKLDLAISGNLAGDLRVLFGNGDGTFAPAVLYALGTETSGLAAGDFNGDGRIDLAVGSRTITQPPLRVLINNGAGGFNAPVHYTMTDVSAHIRSISAADVTGDGKFDLVVGSDNGAVIVLGGVGDGTFTPAGRYLGLGNLIAAAGDLNGDGRVDIVTAGFFNEQITVLLNSAAPDTAPPTVTAAEMDIETAQRVRVTFNEAIDPGTVAASDLVATRLANGQTFSPSAVAMTSGNRVLTFTFNGLPDGTYRFRVPAGAVADPAGNVFAAPYDFETIATFFLDGDANRDRTVNIGDFSILASRFNQPGTFSQGDFNYSGTVEIGDFAILASRFNTSLPEPRGVTGRSSSDKPLLAARHRFRRDRSRLIATRMTESCFAWIN